MTKDYYKILNLRSDATDDEIRARWVELVKSHHITFELGEFDDKVKDINDAYHVLKNPATRLEYDLERTFESKKKGPHLSRWVLRTGFVLVVAVLCVVYFENPEIPQHLIEKSQGVAVLPKVEKRLPISESPKPPAIQVVEKEVPAVAAVPSLPHPREKAGVEETEGDAGPGVYPQAPLPIPLKSTEDGTVDQQKIKETGSALSSGKSAQSKVTRPTSGTPPASPGGGGEKVIRTNLSQRNITRNSSPSKTKGSVPTEKVTKIAQGKTSSPDPVKTTTADPDSPSSLLAREDEVKEFFQNYTKAYGGGDVDAFLALFSLKAVQNRDENFEDLKGIYRRFFSQSRELHYQLQDLKFEIYRNGVEATARYVLDQILKRTGEKRTWRGTIRWVLTREGGVLKIISLDYKHQESL
jgi:hypothetical protein